MLSIRLTRTGRRNAPSYRVVLQPKTAAPSSKALEILGHYNPRMKDESGKPVLDLKADRIKHWIENGAQATDTVWNLLVAEKIVDGKKRGVTSMTKKRTGKMAEKEAEAKEKAEAAKAAAAEAEKAEAPAEEAPAEETKEEAAPEAPAEEAKEEEKAE